MLYYIYDIWYNILLLMGLQPLVTYDNYTFDVATDEAIQYTTTYVQNTGFHIILALAVLLTYGALLYAFYRVSKFYLLKIWRSRKW